VSGLGKQQIVLNNFSGREAAIEPEPLSRKGAIYFLFYRIHAILFIRNIHAPRALAAVPRRSRPMTDAFHPSAPPAGAAPPDGPNPPFAEAALDAPQAVDS
jgi:hypothetical protein